MEIRVQKYNSFYPARLLSERSASATLFAFAVSCSYLLDFDTVYSFHSVFYLGLIGPFIYLKGIRTFCIGKVYPLLCNQRPNYYVIIVHANTR